MTASQEVLSSMTSDTIIIIIPPLHGRFILIFSANTGYLLECNVFFPECPTPAVLQRNVLPSMSCNCL